MKNVDVELQQEEEDVKVEGKSLYKHMCCTKYYYEGGRGRIYAYLALSETANLNRPN